MNISFSITYQSLAKLWNMLDESGTHRVARPFIDMIDSLYSSQLEGTTFAKFKKQTELVASDMEHQFLISYAQAKPLWQLLSNSTYSLVHPFIEVLKSLPDASSQQLTFIDHLEAEFAQAAAETPGESNSISQEIAADSSVINDAKN